MPRVEAAIASGTPKQQRAGADISRKRCSCRALKPRMALAMNALCSAQTQTTSARAHADRATAERAQLIHTALHSASSACGESAAARVIASQASVSRSISVQHHAAPKRNSQFDAALNVMTRRLSAKRMLCWRIARPAFCMAARQRAQTQTTS